MQAWLDDGELYDREDDFRQVLKMIGIDNVEYYNPDYRDEKVYEVYLNVTKPFDTTDISTDMFEQIKDAAENAQVTVGNEADMMVSLIKVENKDIRYSISVDLDKQIDDVLNNTTPAEYTHVYLGETTKALKELGWNDLPMIMTNQHVYSTIKTQEEAKKEKTI